MQALWSAGNEHYSSELEVKLQKTHDLDTRVDDCFYRSSALHCVHYRLHFRHLGFSGWVQYGLKFFAVLEF